MAITNATRLSDFAAGIGTEGAILQIDNANQRIGIGTQLPSQMLEVAGIVTATAFHGDGSFLEGITSAGLGTAISDVDGSVGAVVYYTDDLLTVSETTTINPPNTASAAYTQYRDVKLEDNVDLIIETGDDFIPDVLGFGDDTSDPNAAGNGVFDEVYTSIIKNKDGLGAPVFANGLTSVGVITATGGFSGNVNNSSNLLLKTDGSERARIDSTGRFGIGAQSFNDTYEYLRVQSVSGAGNPSNLSIIGGNAAHSTLNLGDTDDFNIQRIKSDHSTNSLQFYTGDTERLRIASAGQLGIAGANYGTSGQVMTSQGASAAPQWADASGGSWNLLSTTTITSSTEIEIALPQDGAYDEYAIKFINLGVQAGTAFRVRLKVKLDGSLTTGNVYQNGAFGKYTSNSGNASGGGSNGSSEVNEIWENAIFSFCTTLMFYQPTNTVFDKAIHVPYSFGGGAPGSGTDNAWYGAAGINVNDSKTNKLTSLVLYNTGNAGSGTVTWDTGKVKLYGIS